MGTAYTFSIKDFPGYEEILAEGMLQCAHEYVLVVLLERFGERAADLTATIQQIQDKARVDSLHKQAVKARNLNQFRRLLEAE